MKLVCFGDSLTQGAGLLGTGPSYYPYLIAIDKGWRTLNLAVSGSMAADQRAAIYGYSPQPGDVFTYMIGVNDQRINGVNSTKLAMFGDMLAAEAYFLAQQTQNSQAWSRTGTWNTNEPYTTGLVSTTPGSTLTASFTGDVLTFGYIIQDGATGQFSVTIDGADRGTFNTSSPDKIATQNGIGYGPALGRIAGNGAGSHTAVFTTLNSGYVYIDWIGTGAGSSGYPVHLLSIPHQALAGYSTNGGSDANVAAYNSAISAVASQLNSDGMSNVSFIDAGSFVNPATDLLSDMLHPNAQGHVNLSAALARI